MLHNRNKHMAGSPKKCIQCMPMMCNHKDAAQQKQTHGRLPKEAHTLHAHDVQLKRCCTTETNTWLAPQRGAYIACPGCAIRKMLHNRKNTWPAPQRGAYIACPGCAIEKMLHNRKKLMAGSPKRCIHCMPMMCNQKDAAQ